MWDERFSSLKTKPRGKDPQTRIKNDFDLGITKYRLDIRFLMSFEPQEIELWHKKISKLHNTVLENWHFQQYKR